MSDRSQEKARALDQIVSAVSASKKYGSICADTVRRIAERELAGHGNLRSATKAAKRRLHQVYGAFEQPFDYDAAYEQLALAYGSGSELEVKAACRAIMALHSSTRERLPFLDRFYPAIWSITGRPSSILDLGCGLNPLAIPWMGLSPSPGQPSGVIGGPPSQVRYVALDIDADRIRFLNRTLALAGFEPLARCQDVLLSPFPAAGVALLLKMSPSLERQERGATLRLLEEIRAPFVAASFAVTSLGGREKGMLAHYERRFLRLVESRGWPVEKLEFDAELVFVVHKGQGGR
jgi:16S rRNA (guanine(1405)-N(7))-methyltransferase